MKKGFTLIELIAVIVVLAIITLIAVPIISKVVDKARKGAAEASALNYIDAVEKYVILHDLDSTKYPYDLKNNTFNVSSNTEISFLDIIIPRAKAEGTVPSLNSFITVKGDKPKSGTVTLNEKGKVTEAELGFGKYFAECTSGKCVATKEKTSIVIDGEDTVTIAVGDTVELNAITNSDKAITWTSSDNTIATVNNGIVTGVKTGSVIITAKVAKVSTSITVNIIPVEVQIDGDKPRNVLKGTNLELSVTTNSKSNISWTSSDNTIATVNNGVVSPLKYGSVTITATIGDVSDSVTLNIKTGATKVAAPAGVTHKGIVYLNPKNLSDHCTAENSYTVTNRKEGCMKWYIFNDSGSKYKMILAHNSTALIRWINSGGNATYENSNVAREIASYGWDSSLSTRIISADEVNNIVGPKAGWTTNASSRLSFCDTRYNWLVEYMESGSSCVPNNHDDNTYTASDGYSYKMFAYWTSSSTKCSNNGSWYVTYNSDLWLSCWDGNHYNGIRPVIEVDKSIIN